jgi:hypothetical protein
MQLALADLLVKRPAKAAAVPAASPRPSAAAWSATSGHSPPCGTSPNLRQIQAEEAARAARRQPLAAAVHSALPPAAAAARSPAAPGVSSSRQTAVPDSIDSSKEAPVPSSVQFLIAGGGLSRTPATYAPGAAALVGSSPSGRASSFLGSSPPVPQSKWFVQVRWLWCVPPAAAAARSPAAPGVSSSRQTAVPGSAHAMPGRSAVKQKMSDSAPRS